MANVEIRRVGDPNSGLSFPRPGSTPLHISFDEDEKCVITAEEWEAIAPFAEKQGIYKVGAAKGKTSLEKAQAPKIKRAKREMERHRPDLVKSSKKK